jgi:SAM-dependent methyltransferase
LNYFDNINKEYSKLFLKHGDSPKSVMIPKDNQEVRFDSILNHLSKDKTYTYLDYGCGLAHQLGYFKIKKYNQILYTGVDVNSNFIQYCGEAYPDSTFLLYKDFKNLKNVYDIIGAVGTFNLIYSKSNDQWDFIRSELFYLWQRTSKILFVNFMSTDVDYQQENAYHQDVSELYKFVRTNISKKIVIDYSYLPYEFTLIVKR